MANSKHAYYSLGILTKAARDKIKPIDDNALMQAIREGKGAEYALAQHEIDVSTPERKAERRQPTPYSLQQVINSKTGFNLSAQEVADQRKAAGGWKQLLRSHKIDPDNAVQELKDHLLFEQVKTLADTLEEQVQYLDTPVPLEEINTTLQAELGDPNFSRSPRAIRQAIQDGRPLNHGGTHIYVTKQTFTKPGMQSIFNHEILPKHKQEHPDQWQDVDPNEPLSFPIGLQFNSNNSIYFWDDTTLTEPVIFTDPGQLHQFWDTEDYYKETDDEEVLKERTNQHRSVASRLTPEERAQSKQRQQQRTREWNQQQSLKRQEIRETAQEEKETVQDLGRILGIELRNIKDRATTLDRAANPPPRATEPKIPGVPFDGADPASIDEDSEFLSQFAAPTPSSQLDMFRNVLAERKQRQTQLAPALDVDDDDSEFLSQFN